MASVRDYGARGDGVIDDTAALAHAVQRGDGQLLFPRGDYLISRPLIIPLHVVGRTSIAGVGGTAKIIMAGPGPAFHLVGSHRRSAHPDQFVDTVWQRERFPTLRDLEIVGRDPQADGIRIEGAMQPTLQGLLIRQVRHGIHLRSRDRNVLIADCHIYDNRGIGIWLDEVNLHQINIHGNHISYCKQGGIKVAGSEIRNIQICSNDIEYNYDLKADASADVLLDCQHGTIREGTLVGNTVQAVQSPGGANVRMIGSGKTSPNAVGMFTITGNLLGSQHTVLDLRACRGVVVSGNALYSGYHYALRAEDAEHLVVGANSIDHNPDYKGPSTDRLVLERCRNVTLNGLLVQHTRPASAEPPATLEVNDCQNVNITGCQILSARTRGISVQRSSVVRIADSTIRGRSDDKNYRAAVSLDRASTNVMVVNNFLGKGSDGELKMPKEVGVASGNVIV